MNIVMFTPAVQASAIGRMACLVVQALLARGHAVTVVRAESEELLADPAHGFLTEMVPWPNSARVRQLVEQADLLCYQIGDNYQFHRGCLEWLAQAPGIVCLHDYFVAHLFCGWAQHRVEEASGILRAWYGNEAAASFFSHPDSASFIAATHETAPLTEWVCAMATGVVTHSSWGIERVLRACPGPVHVAALPYNAPETLPARPAGTEDGAFHVLTVGHVNPNKRVASVIRAIGASEVLRPATVYRVVGAISSANVVSLSTLARNSQVNLVISDQVETPILNSALAEADVITCLRYPSLEAASASAIEAMLCGKPVIVTDTNFYSEIPDDCVIKIDPNDEIASLQRALERLQGDGALRAELGRRGQEWARATFRADHYAVSLEQIATAASRAKPISDAIDVFARTLRAWGGNPALLAADHTSRPLHLFA